MVVRKSEKNSVVEIDVVITMRDDFFALHVSKYVLVRIDMYVRFMQKLIYPWIACITAKWSIVT